MPPWVRFDCVLRCVYWQTSNLSRQSTLMVFGTFGMVEMDVVICRKDGSRGEGGMRHDGNGAEEDCIALCQSVRKAEALGRIVEALVT